MTQTQYLNGGTLYWRVAAVDADRNQGDFSPAQKIGFASKMRLQLVGFPIARRWSRVTVKVTDFTNKPVGGAAVRGFEPFFGARSFGARFADRFEGGARGLVGGGERGFAFRQAIGGGAAAGRGRLDFTDQRLPLSGEFLRRLVELGALGRCLFGALTDGFDLCCSLVLALAPFGAFADDRL
jgi:hypothetical protein